MDDILEARPLPDFDPRARNHEAPVPRLRGLLARVRQALAPQPYVLGCDLSHWNETVDFKALKAANFEFVILKATEGTSYTDPTFEQRWKAALDADIIVGPYGFLRSNQSGVNQADHHLEVIRLLVEAADGHVIPPANDVETADGVTVPVRRQVILNWDQVIRAGLGIANTLCYSSQYLWQFLTNNMVLDCIGWGAHWTSALTYLWPYGWPVDKRKFIQFGVYPKHPWVPIVPGVTGEADVNKFLGTLDDLRALVGKPKPSWAVSIDAWARTLGYQGAGPEGI